jgi:hypothetical protein
MHLLRVAVVGMLVALAACAPLFPPGGVTTDTSDFTVEAHADTWRGRPIVAGYIYNKRPFRATRMQLRVEALDATGAVVGSEVRFLDRDINPSERAYFDVPTPAQAASYRVTVAYVFWRPGGGGGP